MKIRVLVLEDHQVTLAGLCLALTCEPDIEVVGSATSSDEGYSMASSIAADVILLDLHLPGSRGPRSMVQAFCDLNDSSIVVFSSEKRKAFVDVVLKLGCSAYLLKSETATQVAQCIRRVAAGEKPILSAQLTMPKSKLTRTEHELLESFAQGLKYQEIAERRCTSLSTVRKQCDLILEKLGLSTREELISWAAHNGYGSLETES